MPIRNNKKIYFDQVFGIFVDWMLFRFLSCNIVDSSLIYEDTGYGI